MTGLSSDRCVQFFLLVCVLSCCLFNSARNSPLFFFIPESSCMTVFNRPPPSTHGFAFPRLWASRKRNHMWSRLLALDAFPHHDALIVTPVAGPALCPSIPPRSSIVRMSHPLIRWQTFGLFWFLAIRNKATLNICVHVSVCICFHFLWANS